MRALMQMGPDAVDPLGESLDDDNIRFDVLVVLRSIDAVNTKQKGLAQPTVADLPSLREVLYDANRPAEDRTAAAASLITLGDEGFAVLIQAFEVQEIARTASEDFAKADSTDVPSLVKVLKHQQLDVRGSAADAQGHIGLAASGAVTDLIALLGDEDRDVRYHAVRALHELSPKAKLAVPVLIAIVLNTTEPEATRNWAIKTLVVTLDLGRGPSHHLTLTHRQVGPRRQTSCLLAWRDSRRLRCLHEILGRRTQVVRWPRHCHHHR